MIEPIPDATEVSAFSSVLNETEVSMKGWLVLTCVSLLPFGCSLEAADDSEIFEISQAAQPDDSEWGCVGKVKKWKKPKQPTAEYSVPLIELFSRAPFAGVTAKACAYEDPDCTSPLDETVTGSDGVVRVTVPTGKNGFSGYLELTGNGIQATMSFLNPPVIEDTDAPDFLVLTESTFQGFAAASNVTLMSDRGHIGMAALNCRDEPAAGATGYCRPGFNCEVAVVPMWGFGKQNGKGRR